MNVTQHFSGPVSGYVAGHDVHVHQARSRSDWWEMDTEELLHECEAAERQIAQARQRMRADPLNRWWVALTVALPTYIAIVLFWVWHMSVNRTMTFDSFKPVMEISAGVITALCVTSKYCQDRLNGNQQPDQARIELAEADIEAITIELMRRER